MKRKVRIKNLKGPSGVALGGTGVGYFEIDPTGTLTRNCLQNIHQSFVDRPAGYFVGIYDGKKAARLQRDEQERYGLKGYADSYYTGLWPTARLEFENGRAQTADMSYLVYSGVTAGNILDSSLPVVYYEVNLTNTSEKEQNMSAILSFGDTIGRGIRDTDKAIPSNLDGESSEWKDLAVPDTFAKGVRVGNYTGVWQYTKEPILPQKLTFQNYNTDFLLLAENADENSNGNSNSDSIGGVTILKSFSVKDDSAMQNYREIGKLNDYDEQEVTLSHGCPEGSRQVTNASAVSVMTQVAAGQTKTVRFLIVWFMPEFTPQQLATRNKMEGCDYNKYYHNFFNHVLSLADYAISNRENVKKGISDWQDPLLHSSLPDWLIFKQINAGYTLYTNGVLNKKGNFSTLEGLMGGYGGTMDQKMSSHPFYEKLFPALNRQENLQYANVTGSFGEIQHFDVHYYHGISDSDPQNQVNPTPAGSMIDNTGSWMVQMWNDYQQTGEKSFLQNYYSVMTDSMDFLMTKYEKGTHYPSYYTTYDDYSHPEILIFSGIVWLNMLDLAADWADLMKEEDRAAFYRSEYSFCYQEVNLLYGEHSASLGYGGYYAFGSDGEYLTSKGKKGILQREILFSGAMAGQFISRYSGRRDVIPFSQFVSHMNTFLRTSVQGSPDYYAPKVYNLRTEQDLDSAGSRCWPFYLDSYGGMAAIQAGYVEDGLEILRHTMLVDLRLGYMWTQNLWNRAYATYMTAPVSWFVEEVLAGSALHVPDKTIVLGPSLVGDRLMVPLYYPKYWAFLDYRPRDGVLTYTITHTFYEKGEKPIVIESVLVSPAGKARSEAVSLSIGSVCLEKGCVLDLSAFLDQFAPCERKKLLTPVEPYRVPVPERMANGTGLLVTVTDEKGFVSSFASKEINYTFDREHPPAKGIIGSYVLEATGRILPRYGQKYQLIFEYTGQQDDLEITWQGQNSIPCATAVEEIESKQFVPMAGCRLKILTVEMKEATIYPITIRYKGNLSLPNSQNVLRFLWWSTTQNMGLVIRERMIPLLLASHWIDGLWFDQTDAQAEGDHMAYTKDGCFALYSDLDFGGSGTSRYTFTLLAAAPLDDLSLGGRMEIRLSHPKGKQIGELTFSPTSGWNDYRECSCEVDFGEPISKPLSVCFVFRPKATFLFNYKSFTFQPRL